MVYNKVDFFFLFLSELCWGKAMVAYTMPQQRKKKERSERLRGERDQIKFIDLGFERWRVQYVAIYGTSYILLPFRILQLAIFQI